jgi:hypothetical protein
MNMNIMQIFGNMQNFQKQFQNFQNQMRGINPQQEVQKMLNSGKMSQQQFNQLRALVNQITGRNM